MAIDVLQVNKLRTDSAVANTRANVTALVEASTNVSNYVCYSNIHNNPSYWDTYFPAAPTGGTVLCVGCMRVGTDSYLRCGVCCLWTVPNGVTVAKFEMWGAGAGTLPGCCCSIQPFGATGSYATVCIPVTAGNQYTLCAGCAVCCYLCNAIQGNASGGSYVVGATLCNVCASGGSGCWAYVMMNRMLFPYNAYMQCYMLYMQQNRCIYTGHYCGVNNDASSCGVNICSYGESCIMSNSSTYGVVPSMPDLYYNCTFNGAACLASGEIRKVIGVPSRTSEFCFSGGVACGYVKHPAIPGFVSSSQCCVSWSSTQSTFGGALCSPIAGYNYLTAPGSGGNMVYTVGGCNTNCGDAGRGGMVRVTYC